MHSWNKLWARRYKKIKNPTDTFEEPRAKAGCQDQNQGDYTGLLYTAAPKGGQAT